MEHGARSLTEAKDRRSGPPTLRTGAPARPRREPDRTPGRTKPALSRSLSRDSPGRHPGAITAMPKRRQAKLVANKPTTGGPSAHPSGKRQRNLQRLGLAGQTDLVAGPRRKTPSSAGLTDGKLRRSSTLRETASPHACRCRLVACGISGNELSGRLPLIGGGLPVQTKMGVDLEHSVKSAGAVP